MIKYSFLTNASNFSSIERFGADVLILTLKFKDITIDDVIIINIIDNETLLIDFGDSTPRTSTLSHTYTSDYPDLTVLVYSTIDSLDPDNLYETYYYYNSVKPQQRWDSGKLVSVDQWKTNYFKSFDNAFSSCTNLVSVPNSMTPNVKLMSSMFARASSFNSDISDWDVRNVTDMSSMFQNTDLFNQDISDWNVINVTNMDSMFSGAISFNKPLNKWNTGNVKSMKDMFGNADSFDQDISDWNVSNVTDMSGMFADNKSFNKPLIRWNTGNVKSMKAMFMRSVFNQDISDWNVRNVNDMSGMFIKCAFNQDISKWTFNPDNIYFSYFLNNSALNTSNFDKLLESLYIQYVGYGDEGALAVFIPPVYFDAYGLTYSSSSQTYVDELKHRTSLIITTVDPDAPRSSPSITPSTPGNTQDSTGSTGSTQNIIWNNQYSIPVNTPCTPCVTPVNTPCTPEENPNNVIIIILISLMIFWVMWELMRTVN
jgi:surface protein